jgi:hypothetical protein
VLEPQELVTKLEERADLNWKRHSGFAGYGVMGLPFASGHALGLRRFPTSSLGPEYTSVWHRDPGGQWSMFQDRPPEGDSVLHFGGAVAEAQVRDIRITWSGPRDFTVKVGGEKPIQWDIALDAVPETRFMNSKGGTAPGALWRQPDYLRVMGGVSSVALGAGYLGLEGAGAEKQRFVANPRLIWHVSASAATIDGQPLGDPGPLPFGAKFGGFWIPQRGIFIMGSALFDTPEAALYPFFV